MNFRSWCVCSSSLLVLALSGCPTDDDSPSDGVEDDGEGTSSGGSDPTDPSATNPSSTSPGSSTDPSTSSTTDPSTSTDPTDDTSSTDPSGSSDGSSSTGEPADGMTRWDVGVLVDFGGEFDVTADVQIAVVDENFTSDVVTILIAGQPEEHEIPLVGTSDGDSLTMLDSPFSITVGEVTEDFLLSGEVSFSDGTLVGGGDFTASIDGGDPFAGTFTITSATIVR